MTAGVGEPDPVRQQVTAALGLIVGGAARVAGPPLHLLQTVVRLADGCLLGRGLYGGDRSPVDTSTTDAGVDAPRAMPDAGDAAGVDRPDDGTAGGAVAELPIDDYEHLAASQIVGRLDRLDHAELERVAAFERRHRHRRTVLGKVDRLLAAGS